MSATEEVKAEVKAEEAPVVEYGLQEPEEEASVEEAPAEEAEADDNTEEAVEEDSSTEEDVVDDDDTEVDEEQADEGEEEDVPAPALDIQLIYQAAQLGMTTEEVSEFDGNPAGLRQVLKVLEKRGVATPAATESEAEKRESIEDYEARLKEAGHDDDIIAELVESRKGNDRSVSELEAYKSYVAEQESIRVASEVESVMDSMSSWSKELGDGSTAETAAQSANREKVFGELTSLVNAESASGRGFNARNMQKLVEKAVSNALPAEAKKKRSSKTITAVKKRRGQFVEKPGAVKGDASLSAKAAAISNLDMINPGGKSEYVDDEYGF